MYEVNIALSISLPRFKQLPLILYNISRSRSLLHFPPFSEIMHLWPSLKIRDSFKRAYLEKLELNLHRMKHSKVSAATAPLLSDKSNGGASTSANDEVSTTKSVGLLHFCHDIFMLLTCFCCCFCCGACSNEERNSPLH